MSRKREWKGLRRYISLVPLETPGGSADSERAGVAALNILTSCNYAPRLASSYRRSSGGHKSESDRSTAGRTRSSGQRRLTMRPNCYSPGDFESINYNIADSRKENYLAKHCNAQNAEPICYERINLSHRVCELYCAIFGYPQRSKGEIRMTAGKPFNYGSFYHRFTTTSIA
jgi:hypothetical protein